MIYLHQPPSPPSLALSLPKYSLQLVEIISKIVHMPMNIYFRNHLTPLCLNQHDETTDRILLWDLQLPLFMINSNSFLVPTLQEFRIGLVISKYIA